MQLSSRPDCVVVGSGATGLATALALAAQGLRTLVIGPPLPNCMARDPRTTALFTGSVSFLRHLGVWPLLEGRATALKGLRLIDDTAGILRAPEVLFRAEELGLMAFGFNVENGLLLEALHACARSADNLRIVHGEVKSLAATGAFAQATLADGASFGARLAVGADGRRSLTRSSAGIGVRDWAYPQSAIVTQFRHSRPHDGISTEFHRNAGPLTTVPLGDNTSSLVWVEEPAAAQRLVALTADGFGRELDNRLQGLLGSIADVGPRAAFPLSGLTAERMTGERVALIGEAAHVLPPIGAQGLNLGLRDAATLAEVVSDAAGTVGDPGHAIVLADYERRRRPDVLSRAFAVDLLNRSLIHDLVPLHLARGAALHILNSAPWLRRLVMREGMQPSSALPRSMRS